MIKIIDEPNLIVIDTKYNSIFGTILCVYENSDRVETKTLSYDYGLSLYTCFDSIEDDTLREKIKKAIFEYCVSNGIYRNEINCLHKLLKELKEKGNNELVEGCIEQINYKEDLIKTMTIYYNRMK